MSPYLPSGLQFNPYPPIVAHRLEFRKHDFRIAGDRKDQLFDRVIWPCILNCACVSRGSTALCPTEMDP